MTGPDPVDPSNPGAADADATRTGLHAGADLAPGTIVAGRFRVEGLLGIGGMGVVYRATDLSLDVPVAIKVLRPEIAERPGAFERFRNELLLARQVSSPQVLRIHDIARDGERWLISMDFVDGKPLDRLLDERGALPVEEALAIARQVALGLSAAHAQGVVHRDLKPSNILVASDGRAWVGDFGIARSLGGSGLTHTGQVIGTPDYLSPEQARAEPVDARSDLYALGLVLYEMLTGHLPFEGGTAAETLSQRMVATPPPIRGRRSDVPAWVERLLERLLQARPARRFADAQAVVKAIDSRHVARDLRPTRAVVAILATLLAVVAIAALWLWRPSPSGPVATPLPDRLVLLPATTDGADGVAPEVLDAATELLRLRLNEGALPVVDGERVDQAVAQLSLGGRASKRVDLAALRAALPATTIVQVRIAQDGGAYSADATVQPARGEARKVRARGPDAAAAIDALAGELAGNAPDGARAAVPASLRPIQAAALAAYGRGLDARRRGRTHDALQAFGDATAADPAFAAAWLARAQAAFQAGQREQSLEAAQQGMRLPVGDVLRARLKVWEAMNAEPRDAAFAAQRAIVARRPDDLDAQLLLATLQANAGDLPAAAAALQALVARDPGDPRAWFLLGKTSIMRGELRPAVEEQLVRALVLYKRGRNAFGEAETVNALGIGYARLGQPDDAEEQFRLALDRRRALGDERGTASTLRNLAQQATVRGRFDDAQAQLEEARALFDKIGDDAGLQAVDNELGLLAEERGDFIAAAAAYRRMLRSREQAGDAAGVAESLNNIGYAQFQLGDYDSAHAFWQQALAAFVAQRDLNGQVRARQNLGLLEIARGNLAPARQLLESSLALAERQQMAEEASVSLRNLAELDVVQGRGADAMRRLDRAHALFGERGDQRGLVDVDLLRQAAHLGAGRLDDAAAIAPALAEASNEQAAIAALQRARLARARGQESEARAALAQAQARAAASGVARWKLEAELLAGDAPSPALRMAVADLGNVPLQLALSAHAIRASLAAGDNDAAVGEYRRAAAMLARLDAYGDAATLHRLGAQALTANGADGAAREATRLADAAAQAAPVASGPASTTEPAVAETPDER